MEAAKDAKRKLNKDRKRHSELDTIIKKLYESFAVGRFLRNALTACLLSTKSNRKTFPHRLQKRRKAVDGCEEDTDRVEQFLALAKKYTDFSELTTPMINEFIDKIIVHAPERIDGKGRRR